MLAFRRQHKKTNLDWGADGLETTELNIETRFTVIHDVSEGVKLTWEPTKLIAGLTKIIFYTGTDLLNGFY